MTLNFDDFYKTEFQFDVDRLKQAYNEVIKIKKFETINNVTKFRAISLTQIPGDAKYIERDKARGVF